MSHMRGNSHVCFFEDGAELRPASDRSVDRGMCSMGGSKPGHTCREEVHPGRLRADPAARAGLFRGMPGTRRNTSAACGAEGCTAPGEEGRKRRGDRKNIDWAGGAVVDMPPPRSRRRDEYGYFLRSGRRSYCFCRKKTPRRDRCLVYRAPFAASLFLFIFFPLAFLCSVKCSRYTYVLCDPEML